MFSFHICNIYYVDKCLYKIFRSRNFLSNQKKLIYGICFRRIWLLHLFLQVHHSHIHVKLGVWPLCLSSLSCLLSLSAQFYLENNVTGFGKILKKLLKLKKKNFISEADLSKKPPFRRLVINF